MISKLTWKYRYFLLLAAFFMVLILAYNLAFIKTIELRGKFSQIDNELNIIEYGPNKIAAIEKRINQIESLYGSDFEDLEKLQEKLLQHISQSCKQYQLVLIELPNVHEFKNNDYTIKTFKIVVEGDFINLIKFIYDLEFKPALGRIASVKLFKQTDFKTNSEKLFAQIIIQNIEL